MELSKEVTSEQSRSIMLQESLTTKTIESDEQRRRLSQINNNNNSNSLVEMQQEDIQRLQRLVRDLQTQRDRLQPTTTSWDRDRIMLKDLFDYLGMNRKKSEVAAAESMLVVIIITIYCRQ